MGSKGRRVFSSVLVAGFLVASGMRADDATNRWLQITFPHDSPVLPVSSLLGAGPISASVRGTSLVIGLHASLLLRNTGTKALSGLTLMVEAQDPASSGRGSVTVPSLHAQPGEVFPVRIDMELVRPFNMTKSEGAMMQLSLDCALFSDLSAYGPDRLHSRRMLVVYELEARRDRRYYATLLETGRLAELRQELNFGLPDSNTAQLSFEILHSPGAPVQRKEQPVRVGAVLFPSSPVEPLGGDAQIAGNEIRTSRLALRNTSGKSVKGFDVGWIVRDEHGRDFVAGSVPSAMPLAPVQTADMVQPGTLRFSHPTGQAMVVDGLLAFVNNVEFSDGKLWIPTRADITEATKDPILRRALGLSPEQQRLADVYRRRGRSGLEQELKRLD